MEARRKVTTQANTDIIPVIDICSSEDEDSANEAWSIVVIKKVVEKELLLDTSAGEIERQCKTWAEVSRKTDQESPLDLTKKRHLVDADLRKNNETKDNQYEESVKRTRPSVITFGGPPTPTHQAELPCERDPTDHFVQALGTDVYRKVFGDTTVDRGRPRDGVRRKPVINQTSRGDPLVDEHFKKSLGETIWKKVQSC